MGIEPTPEAWEAAVLPLNYTRLRNEAYHKRLADSVNTALCNGRTARLRATVFEATITGFRSLA
jgi:hypothetical protein